MDVYLIPGLGADHRLFERLQLAEHRIVFLDWPEMPAGTSIGGYAAVLAARVDATRKHALVGVSMGGMVAQEMAALTAPARVVILSSWKGPQEMPHAVKLLRATHPERMLTSAVVQRARSFLRWQLGASTPASAALLDQYLDGHDLARLKVQIAAVLDWQGPARPVEGLVHIHGDSDHLMPLAPIRGPLVVRGGGHFMVHTMPDAVGRLLQEALRN